MKVERSHTNIFSYDLSRFTTRLPIWLFIFLTLIFLLLPGRTSLAASNPLPVTVTKVTSWKEGKTTCTQFSVKLSNTGNKNITNWKLALVFNRKVALREKWCGSYTAKKATVTIKPLSYNKTIAPKGCTEIGFIVKASGTTSFKKATITSFRGGKKSVFTQTKAVPSANKTSAGGSASSGNSTSSGNSASSGTNASAGGTASLDSSSSGQGSSTQSDSSSSNSSLSSSGKTPVQVNGRLKVKGGRLVSDGNPQSNQKAAIKFFTEMAKKYRNYKNVIYEICNEPNGNVSWKQIRSYASSVIKAIRSYDKNNLILIGTPNWSQDVDTAAQSPIKGYQNLMYTFHFYAGTHRESYRNKVKTAIKKGLPVFVSEFGITDASGNGNVNKSEGNRWMTFLKQNGISYVCWNLSNKNESSALIRSSCSKVSGFKDSELSAQGLWYKKQ